MTIKGARAVCSALPALPGVYQFCGGGKALYVGKAANLKRRVSSYFSRGQRSPRLRLMLQEATTLNATVAASPAEALLIENNLIKTARPKYNILFRDDKSYPYLRLSKHAYPRLAFYRGAAKKADADYFGPFPDSGAVRESMDILQRVFRLRVCADGVLANRARPCMLHGIGRCSAPCVNKISAVAYAADAARARAFLAGKSAAVANALAEQMQTAAQAQRFEEAAALRDRLRALSVVRARHFAEDHNEANADYVGAASDGRRVCVNVIMVRGGRRVGERAFFPQNAGGDDEGDALAAFLAQRHPQAPAHRIVVCNAPSNLQEAAPQLAAQLVCKPRGAAAAKAAAAAEGARHALANGAGAAGAAAARRVCRLQERLQLATAPRRIECFDISHSMGEETMAARVVFADGLPQKREYRLFRIRAAGGGDDAAAIGEAVFRCYRRATEEKTALPDLLLIDGGVAQVAAACAAAARAGAGSLAIFGVAKGAARRPGQETLIGKDGETLRLAPTDAALHLIQAARDEAHRFAVAGHRRRRDKKRGRSYALDGIAGVGEEKRRALLAAFGGLAALRAAGVKQLATAPGIGPALAARIYRALRRA